MEYIISKVFIACFIGMGISICMMTVYQNGRLRKGTTLNALVGLLAIISFIGGVLSMIGMSVLWVL